MNIEVLVAAMNQKDHSLLEKMNIQSDVIVGNQCDHNSVDKIEHNGNKAVYLNFDERGVGLNRNNALFRATGDILIFADEDERFEDGYEDTVKKAYEKLPDADAIIFNIVTVGKDVGRRDINKASRLNIFNALNYGAARLSVKNSAVKRCNISFHRQFGGGTDYSSGEDTLFISSLLKNKLKVYAYPAVIASVEQTQSTWFNGYNEKYFYDKGALFAALSPKFGWLLCRLLLLKNKKEFFGEEISYRKGIALAKAGKKGFKNGVTYAGWAEK